MRRGIDRVVKYAVHWGWTVESFNDGDGRHYNGRRLIDARFERLRLRKGHLVATASWRDGRIEHLTVHDDRSAYLGFLKTMRDFREAIATVEEAA